MVLTRKQVEICKSRISHYTNLDTLYLPNIINTEDVYKSIHYNNGNRGCFDLKFKVKIDESSQLQIDYFLITDDYSIHKRINGKGLLFDLENYEGQFGLPIFDSKDETDIEHDRIKKRNQIVFEILKSKGFES